MFETLTGQTILITGATGLIGKTITKYALEKGANVIAVVRDVEKAQKYLGFDNRIRYLVSDITELTAEKMEIDYIIHAAASTSSKSFVQKPVDISYTAIEGTRRILELSRINEIKGLVYLSSMEVYGTPRTDEMVDELHSTNVNTMETRSSYPESKRMCESLCSSYYAQYGVPAKVIRLAQTFGPGVKYDDGRVFAEFARCVIEKRDIVLHTSGRTKRNYLYTRDAATAILTVLIQGNEGEAYNAANEETYCSIYEMATMVAEECAKGSIRVKIEEKADLSQFGYADTLCMNLDSAKLRKLGWTPQVGLKEMYDRLIESFEEMHSQE